MKKSELAILSVLILAAVFVFNGKINKVTNPCVQDYVAGQGNIKGNVNVEDYYERDARFAIGAGEDGYAVFKDPGEAFAALREHYPEGISLIRKEFHPHPKRVPSALAFKAQLPLLPNLRLASHDRLGGSAPAGPICQQVF